MTEGAIRKPSDYHRAIPAPIAPAAPTYFVKYRRDSTLHYFSVFSPASGGGKDSHLNLLRRLEEKIENLEKSP